MRTLTYTWLLIMSLFFNSANAQPLYLNPQKPLGARVADLVSRMTLDEKISQMQFNAPAIKRLKIPQYNWWNECLHGVARAGVATVFPQSIALAATWDADLMFRVATVISDEARAKHREFVRKGQRRIYQGLTFWSPNINIFRDPRWGRGQETYGEDPYLTSRMGVAFVKGLQGDDPRYLKVVSTPKHFVVHSGPEPERHEFNAVVNERELRETYLPAFRACVVDGQAFSVMGAYNRTNGEACCASDFLLKKILRGEWEFPGYVVSDCGAIRDIYQGHKLADTPAEAAAMAVKAGCDLNCGSVYPYLKEALKKGLITEQDIDLSVSRLFTARFRLGMFDPPEMVPYAQIPYSVNDSPKHRQLALETARKSIVLLKNENHFLPLKKNLQTIAVIGPNADEVDVLLGNYNGTPSRAVTPLEGIRNKVSPATRVLFASGCNLAMEGPVIKPIPGNVLHPAAGGRSQNGLLGEYFNDMDLQGEPALKRIDKMVNFSWYRQSPATEVTADSFSGRWTGVIVPPVSGDYHFGVSGNNGYRLFFDGHLVIDKWTDEIADRQTLIRGLEAGREHNIKLEFYEKVGDAGIKLEWALPDADPLAEALKIAGQADVIIMVGGISPRLEGEEMNVDVPGFKGGDRTNLKLPSVQENLLKKLHETGKPVVLVLLNGSALAVNWANVNIPAIVEAWYPGQEGGSAIADMLFGDYNPGGRLPVTFYKSVEQLPPFEDYNMAGRTYRYFSGEVLYPFGYGLSYTIFKYDNFTVEPRQIRASDSTRIRVDVTNTGEVAGDEVVQLYLRDVESSVPVPLKSLQGFRRIFLKPGETQKITFELTPEQMVVYDKDFKKIIEPGEFEVTVGGNSQEGLRARFLVLE